jgi:hypothetical protein
MKTGKGIFCETRRFFKIDGVLKQAEKNLWR